jgi:hypothetical protein
MEHAMFESLQSENICLIYFNYRGRVYLNGEGLDIFSKLCMCDFAYITGGDVLADINLALRANHATDLIFDSQI